MATAELNMLADLLGRATTDAEGGGAGAELKPFKLTLFGDDPFFGFGTDA